MGLSRNKVAVPEGVAGTPPFWSLSLTEALESVYEQVFPDSLFCNIRFGDTLNRHSRPDRESQKFFENTERDLQEVKQKIELV